MYIKIINGVPEKYTIGQLRRDNPDTSFPKNIPEGLLADYGVYPLTVAERPEHDWLTEGVIEGPIEQVNGAWTQTWVVQQLPTEDAAQNVRSKRNRLLAASDWTQVADAPVDQTAWATYRQALRDVPQQTGFPFSVVWPTAPE